MQPGKTKRGFVPINDFGFNQSAKAFRFKQKSSRHSLAPTSRPFVTASSSK